MSDPSSLEPEKLAGGGGILVAVLGFFRWMFVSRMAEVHTEMKELKELVAALGKSVDKLSLEVAVANKDSISRKEFEELKSRIHHIEIMMEQGVIGRGG